VNVKTGVRVLDSYSLIAYFEAEAGAKKVAEALKTARDSGVPLLLNVVNWGEVFYITLREAGSDRVNGVVEAMSSLPIEIIVPDLELTEEAARLKARGGIAYADCFAAALAKLRKAELVTGDPEFKRVEDVVKILWID
jgi:predicted nucleic acid-binding protein